MSLTGSALVVAAIRTLTDAGVPHAARDARLLLAHAMGADPGRLTLLLPEAVASDAKDRYAHLIARRAAREPVSHLTGRRMFYGRDFAVTADVLDPRPETETLIEAALAEPFETVLDLGTGSGCILLTLLAEMPGSRGLGTDVSPGAVALARANADALGLANRAQVVVADWAVGVTGLYDLIVANPPYIAAAEMAALAPEVRDWEPHLALTDGGDGLAAYRAIFAAAAAIVTPAGRIVVEIGPTQGAAVSAIAMGQGYEVLGTVQDMDGRDRVVVTRAIDIPF